MDWKWRCNQCGKVLEDAEDVMRHVVKQHGMAMNYATPVAMDTFKIKKEEPTQRVPKKPVNEDVEIDDLRIE